MSDNIILLFRDHAHEGTLSGGGFEPSLPLSNIVLDNKAAPARTTSTDLQDTLFEISFDAPRYSRALVIYNTNLTPTFSYRLRGYIGEVGVDLAIDTGWVQPAAAAGSPAMEWGANDFWTRSADRPLAIIHPFDAPIPAKSWLIEIDDQTNPDGYLDLGYLWMSLGWQPSLNYVYGSNAFGLTNNTLASSTLAGGKRFLRRVNPRTFRFGLDFLTEAEGFGVGFRFADYVGFDRKVFVIPDPADVANMHVRSFFGTISALDALSQAVFGHIGMGFQIEESL